MSIAKPEQSALGLLRAITKIVVSAAIAVGCLVGGAATASADPDARGKASLAIIRVGEPAVPGLVEMLKSEDPQRRATATSTPCARSWRRSCCGERGPRC